MPYWEMKKKVGIKSKKQLKYQIKSGRSKEPKYKNTL